MAMKAPFTAADAQFLVETWEEKVLINLFNTIRDAALKGATSVTILDKLSNNMLTIITGVGFRVEFDLSNAEKGSYRITWDRLDDIDTET